MNNIQKRFLLFLFGCIVVRFIFVYVAKNYQNYLLYMGFLALLISIGFLYVYFSKSRQTGREVFDEKIWWNDLRPIHALLYLLFAIFALNKVSYSWVILFIDVLIGLISFLLFHYNQGNIKLLFN
jgi:hypothetical protein